MEIGQEKRGGGQADAVRLAGMLARLEVFKKKVDGLKSLSMMAKASQAEVVLEQSAALLTDVVFIVHQYAGRAERLEKAVEVLAEVSERLDERQDVFFERLNKLHEERGLN
jgi:hypothetical protein